MLKIVSTLFIFLFVVPGYGQKVKDFNFQILLQNKLKHTVNEIDVSTAVKDTSILYLDARELKEYNVSHIKNAQHIGYKKFTLENLNDIDKNRKIVVYCSVGYRSEKIVAQLMKKGYNNCYNLYGGIFEWVNENHAVYDSKNQKTNKVHVYSSKWSVWLNKGEKIYN